MNDILQAFITLKKSTSFRVRNGSSGNIIQLVGSGLEDYVKDLFSGIHDPAVAARERLRKRSSAFSYLGTSNQPPDGILRGGDAIEVKKVDSLRGRIQLNSSPPKVKLLSADTRINSTCREIAIREGWEEKDIFYVVGSQAGNRLARLWFVYGDCYAASHQIYESVYQRVKNSIANDFDGVKLADTNEIAGIPKIDPLDITSLRVRGMWLIKNPSVVFEDYIESSQAEFKAYSIMRASKYGSFDSTSKRRFEEALDDTLGVTDIEIPDPDNPANIINAKLIKYEI